MRRTRPNIPLVSVLATLSLMATGCSSANSVAGHAYQADGVKIEFLSGGNARVSGPLTQTCSYSQDGKAITLACEDDKTAFNVEEDGVLSGPPDGMMARLIKVK